MDRLNACGSAEHTNLDSLLSNLVNLSIILVWVLKG